MYRIMSVTIIQFLPSPDGQMDLPNHHIQGAIFHVTCIDDGFQLSPESGIVLFLVATIWQTEKWKRCGNIIC